MRAALVLAFLSMEERRKERKRRRLEAVEAEEAKLRGDAEQISGSSAY